MRSLEAREIRLTGILAGDDLRRGIGPVVVRRLAGAGFD